MNLPVRVSPQLFVYPKSCHEISQNFTYLAHNLASMSTPLHQASLIFACIFITITSSAQRQPLIWLFGDHNGVDFRSGSPVAITNPNISYHGAEVKGVATVTDATGNLLFYAENETVYNRNHDTMVNGAKMKSSWASAQTFLTVRAIHDTTLYYLFGSAFHQNEDIPYNISYSVIDIKAANGLGAVVNKNIPLIGNSTTQLCAIRHCNQRDIWVISHQWNSDLYYAYLITAAGVSANPVISKSGRFVGDDPTWGPANAYGYMKGSTDGKKLAGLWSIMGLDLSDFDNATGKVSNSIDLQLLQGWWAYAHGLEFSPDSKLLYANHHIASQRNYLYQYDISAGSPAAIIASKTQLENIYFHGCFASMQIGPDDKIYISAYGQPYLSVINQPNVKGVGCNYVLQGVPLADRCSHGLPAYIESIYYPETTFTFDIDCLQRVSFNYEKPANIVSVKWDFGDPASTAENTSTELEPVHQYAASGNYTVKLIRFTACDSDTLGQQVVVNKLGVELGKDTTVCEGQTIVLDAGDPQLDYTWQDGSKNSSFTVNSEGLYFVTASNGACTVEDSIQINYKPKPAFNLGADKEFCNGEHLVIGEQLQNTYLYQWDNGSTSSTRTINQPGTYRLTATNECGTFTDELIVKPGQCALALPNSFSPNGDGKNDVFKLSTSSGVSSFVMQIFNRWGQKIFESRDPLQGWNGSFAGKDCDIGHYAYSIQFVNDQGAAKTLKGMVLLLR